MPRRVIPARASFEMFAFATTHAAARVATRVTTGDRACTSSARRVAPRPVRGASHVVLAGEGNPFVEGWLDLSATVTGGGADLGVSELAENLGSDVYMDINGWCALPHLDPCPPHRRLCRAIRVNSCAPLARSPAPSPLLPPASSHLDLPHSRARRHLFLKDAKYHVPLARIVSQRIAADGNRFDEDSITQILKDCPVKVGGGKSQVKLFDLMPNMCVQDFLKIAEDYADDL